jgi:hypothetical protein
MSFPTSKALHQNLSKKAPLIRGNQILMGGEVLMRAKFMQYGLRSGGG